MIFALWWIQENALYLIVAHAFYPSFLLNKCRVPPHNVRWGLSWNIFSKELSVQKRSRYEEDVFPGNHTSVWGSWWKDGEWGYACCHQSVKNSYCTGIAFNLYTRGFYDLLWYFDVAGKRTSTYWILQCHEFREILLISSYLYVSQLRQSSASSGRIRFNFCYL